LVALGAPRRSAPTSLLRRIAPPDRLGSHFRRPPAPGTGARHTARLVALGGTRRSAPASLLRRSAPTDRLGSHFRRPPAPGTAARHTARLFALGGTRRSAPTSLLRRIAQAVGSGLLRCRRLQLSSRDTDSRPRARGRAGRRRAGSSTRGHRRRRRHGPTLRLHAACRRVRRLRRRAPCAG